MIPQLQSLTAFATGMPSMEALRVQVQQKGRRREHRAPRSHLVVHCVESSEHSSTLEGRHVVLSGDKVRTLHVTIHPSIHPPTHPSEHLPSHLPATRRRPDTHKGGTHK